MKLTLLRVKNFRCYEDSLDVPFHDLTVFVGENDSGKSSLLHALSVLLLNSAPSQDDFRDKEKAIDIDASFSPREGEAVDESLLLGGSVKVRLTALQNAGQKYQILRQQFVDDRLNNYASTLKAPDLQSLATELGLSPARLKPENLKIIEEYIEKNKDTLPKNETWVEIKFAELRMMLPVLQRYSSSDYGNPENAVKKTLDNLYATNFYEQSKETGELTLKAEYQTLKESISTELNNQVEEELLKQVKTYIKGATSVEGEFDIDFTRGLQFSGLKVGVNGGDPKLLSQYGEGTRKRAFLSILEWDADIAKELQGRDIIKAYDEPDANLHYAAQRDLYTVIEKSSKDNPNIQNILCTHSLSMIDRAPAISINRILVEDEKSRVDYLTGLEDDDIRIYLEQVSELSGIRNSSIFYEKAFLLYEGESEEASLPILYKTYTGRSLAEDGIVLINLQTNGQWSNALKFLNKNRAVCTVMVLDADTQYPTSDCQVTLQRLQDIGFDSSFLSSHCFFAGSKEFEDTYEDVKLAVVANAVFPKHDGTLWTEGDFVALRSSDKFSEQLRVTLSREARKSVGKPKIAHEMANSYSKEDIEVNTVLKSTFDKLIEITRGV